MSRAPCAAPRPQQLPALSGGLTMPRMMFDSDVIADLPRAALCATYSDLIPDAATLARLRAEFPHGLVLIDRHGDPTGQATVLDVETSLHTPDQAPGWFDGKQREGIAGTIYAKIG